MCIDIMLLSLMSTSEICSFHDLRSYATFPKNIFKNPNIRDTILLHPILSLEKKHEEYYQVIFRFSMCGLRSGCERFLMYYGRRLCISYCSKEGENKFWVNWK